MSLQILEVVLNIGYKEYSKKVVVRDTYVHVHTHMYIYIYVRTFNRYICAALCE